MFLYNSIFLLLFNYAFILALNLIKIGEWKREDYYLYPNEESQNDSNNSKNFVFSEKNDKSNAYGLNFDKNNNNCIAIDIN